MAFLTGALCGFLLKRFVLKFLTLFGLPSSIYIPDDLSTDSTNSNGQKCVFSAAGPVTLPKIEQLSLTILGSMLGGFLLTHES